MISNKKIFQVSPFVDEAEFTELKSCFDDRWLTEGHKTTLLKAELSSFIGVKHCFPVPNGTLALFLALLALEPQPGDQIIVPSFTFFGSASSAYFAGFELVFCDVNPDTYTIDFNSFCEKVTPRTKAVMFVNIYGGSIPFDDLITYCHDNNIKIIEDSAQALGVRINSRHSGTFGDVATFSFFADKTLTSGEGGCVVTDCDELASKIALIRNQGRPNSGTFIHPSMGMNFRSNDLSSSVLLVQLSKFNLIHNRKLELFNLYRENLSHINAITLPSFGYRMSMSLRFFFM